MLFIILLGIFGAGLVVTFFVLNLINSRKHISKLFDFELLSIEFPKPRESGEGKKPLHEIYKTSQLLTSLHNLKITFVLEVAVENIGEDITFYLAVPKGAATFTTNHILGLWPEAQVKPASEYSIFESHGPAIGAYIKQKRSEIIPIKTFEEAKLDTCASILSSFADLELVGEGMALQIVAKPAGDDVKGKVLKTIDRLKKGVKLEEALKEPLVPPPEMKKIGTAISVLSPETKKDEIQEKMRASIDAEAIKSLTQKISKPLFRVNVRLVASAISQFRAQNLLENLAQSFSQFASPSYNEFKAVKPRKLKDFIFKFTMRDFDAKQAIVLNADELTSIFHLPTSTTQIPKIRWLKTKEVAPPANLGETGTLIGESIFRGQRKPVYISDEDKRRHIYVIGQTGTGKSTLLSRMAAHDIQNGKGIAVIDPHGDMIETIIGMIPEERFEDVIIFDASDQASPLGINILEYDSVKPEAKAFMVNEIFGILDKIYDLKIGAGPTLEHYFKSAILLLLETHGNEPSTILEIPRVFTDSEYRRRKLSLSLSSQASDFWEKEIMKPDSKKKLKTIAEQITVKFGPLLGNDYIRMILGQPRSAFSFRNIMDHGKILLVNLAKGKIGESNAKLIGMVITEKLLLAALSRADSQNPEERRDFSLYLDEFQNFTTDSIATMLSEARKYRLSLIMAHQFIGQLSERIRDAVIGNVGSIIAFRIGAADAEFLGSHFAPIFEKSDLISIDNFSAYAKILMSGESAPPFNIKALPISKNDWRENERLKTISRNKYGREREKVALEIIERSKK